MLIEDAGRGSERLFQPASAAQRRGSPQPKDIQNWLRYGYGRSSTDLLLDELDREDTRQIVGIGGLPGARMQGRRQWGRKVPDHVVPGLRNVAFRKSVSFLCHEPSTGLCPQCGQIRMSLFRSGVVTHRSRKPNWPVSFTSRTASSNPAIAAR